MDNKKTFKTWDELSLKEKMVRLFMRRILILTLPLALIIALVLSYIGSGFSAHINPAKFTSNFIQYFVFFTVVEVIFAFKKPSKKSNNNKKK